MKKHKKYWIPIMICLVMMILNILAWISTPLCDFYVSRIFPAISTPYAFLSNLLPFSFGELLIALGVLVVVIGIPLSILLQIFRKSKRKKIRTFTIVFLLWVLTFVSVTESLNCIPMYHCTPFSERYFDGGHEFDTLDAFKVWRICVEQANALSEQVQRDENGFFVLTDDLDSTAHAAMEKLSSEYPQLRGFYPNPKPIFYSYLMAQTGLLGIFFPFSMEANYNRDMCDICKPSTVCHELSHLKGIIQEDEANFISFLAASQSDSVDFRYSAYIDILEYLNNEIDWFIVEENGYQAEETDILNDHVFRDMFCFMPKSYFKENAYKEIISTETINVVEDKAMETSLQINGVEDGMKSYSRVVTLVLEYYLGGEK